MKNIKRLFAITLLTLAMGIFSFKTEAQNDFVLTVHNRVIQNVMGVQHQKLNVTMRFNGVSTSQQINYIGANVSTNKNVSVVALDNFTKDDFSRGTIFNQIENSQKRYPDQKIVAAVNGDFFDINSSRGQDAATAGPHIRDGKVIFQGYSYGSAYSAGVKTDGTPFIGRIKYDGYHAQIYDEDGSLKLKNLPVKINEAPAAGKLSVFLPSYKYASALNGRKMIVKTDETIIHRGPGKVELGRYFLSGKLLEVTSEELDEIAEGTMVLMGDDFFLEDLITANDTIRVQNKLSGEFADVYQAVSGNTLLLENGVVKSQGNKDVHPRTAVGLKADGTLFFITVDGRQAPDYVGVNYEQLGEILKFFGAVIGFNLDGGGSTTVAVYDSKTDNYLVHNSPSDGFHRRDANGIGFIYGTLEFPLAPVPYPDTREVLDEVSGIFIEGNKLSFTPVANAQRYVINIGGTLIETTDTEVILNVDPGMHDISIVAYGEHANYKKSGYAEFMIETYSPAVTNVMDVLYGYGKKSYQYLNK